MAGYALTKVCTKCGIEKEPPSFYKSSSSRCKECVSAHNKRYYADNKEGILQDRALSASSRRESILVYNQEYYKSNREKILIQKAEYGKLYPDRLASRNVLRKAYRSKATPAFIDTEAVSSLYKEAAKLSRDTGVAHHVDHIIPLRSKLVCGLHWEGNLQIITAEENLRKGNRVWPNMP